ncbi:MAG: hypothetical protein RBR02_06245 [Desulfuromonadaceae bacterium]|nr:hypothetical protein [Desulfuromonadaceae bacterium]
MLLTEFIKTDKNPIGEFVLVLPNDDKLDKEFVGQIGYITHCIPNASYSTVKFSGDDDKHQIWNTYLKVTSQVMFLFSKLNKNEQLETLDDILEYIKGDEPNV